MHPNTMPGASSWIAGRRPVASPRFRVFCFPYAGIGTSAFRSWDGGPGAGIEICPVQLPGRETRQTERPFNRMPPLVEAALAGLAPYLDVPFALFGHSMGALVAFELARLLRHHAGLTRVFVSARRAPHLSEPRPPIAHLPNPELAAAIQQRYGGIPQPVMDSPDLLDLLLPRLRADFEVLESYQCRPDEPLPCAISVFGGRGDSVPEEDLRAWQAHTTDDVALRMVAGGHLYLESHRTELLQSIARDLALDRSASEVAS